MPRGEQPFLSVVIPSFNRADYLESTLCSVLDQGRRDVELIVVDGGSDDASVMLLSAYDQDLAYWTTRWDAGPAEAVAHGWSKARGRYVMTLAADDVLFPGAVDVIARRMHDRPDTAWLACDAARLDERDHRLGDLPAQVPADLASVLRLEAAPLALGASVFARDAIERLGPVDTALDHAFGYEFVCRALAEGVVPDVLACAVVGLRDVGGGRASRAALHAGREHVEVAKRYLGALTEEQRAGVRFSIAERSAVYTLAEHAAQGSAARRAAVESALRRPWWLASGSFRRRFTDALAPAVRRAA
jgi:hypothetical protein